MARALTAALVPLVNRSGYRRNIHPLPMPKLDVAGGFLYIANMILFATGTTYTSTLTTITIGGRFGIYPAKEKR